MALVTNRNGNALARADMDFTAEQVERMGRINSTRTHAAVAKRKFAQEIAELHEKLMNESPLYRKRESLKRKLAILNKKDKDAVVELDALITDAYKATEGSKGKRMVDALDETVEDAPTKRLGGRRK